MNYIKRVELILEKVKFAREKINDINIKNNYIKHLLKQNSEVKTNSKEELATKEIINFILKQALKDESIDTVKKVDTAKEEDDDFQKRLNRSILYF